MRSELEDLSFRYAEPEKFQEIQQGVDDRVKKKQAAMETISSELQEQLKKEGIPCEISGRVKHYYSVYRKLDRQGIDLDQVFDLVALRVIVPSEKYCYQVLGLTHGSWTPIPSRFKDYIAQPKMNGYRTLHTTVTGIHGDCVEIQIRTRDMHREAEQGVASHWMYKERGGFDQKDEKTFQFLRTLLSTLQEISDPRRFLDTMRLDLFPDQVYVLTPRGEVKELPRGSTPIDFAYKIHTEVGNHCIGAKVGGRIVPLRYELKNGDVIEILTAKSKTPKKDWLNIVKTPDARSRIRAWIRSQEREQVQALGKEVLEKGLKKQGLQYGKLIQEGELKAARGPPAASGRGQDHRAPDHRSASPDGTRSEAPRLEPGSGKADRKGGKTIRHGRANSGCPQHDGAVRQVLQSGSRRGDPGVHHPGAGADHPCQELPKGEGIIRESAVD
jgi:GTP pyrophosphokinase